MSADQIEAAYLLALKPQVKTAHSLICECRGESFEFFGNYKGWVEAHVQAAPDQSEPLKIVQGCIENMGVEVKNSYCDSLTNSLLS